MKEICDRLPRRLLIPGVGAHDPEPLVMELRWSHGGDAKLALLLRGHDGSGSNFPVPRCTFNRKRPLDERCARNKDCVNLSKIARERYRPPQLDANEACKGARDEKAGLQQHTIAALKQVATVQLPPAQAMHLSQAKQARGNAQRLMVLSDKQILEQVCSVQLSKRMLSCVASMS